MSTLEVKELSHPSGEVIKIAAGKTLDLKSQGSVTMPTGSVIQVVSQKFNPSVVSTTSTSMIDTGVSLGITLSATTNKCLVSLQGGHGYVNGSYPNGLIETVCQGATTTYSTSNDVTGGATFGLTQIYNSTNLNTAPHSMSILDESHGTLTPTYRIFFKSRSGGNVVWHEATSSHLTLTIMEIQG
jgi:hypothetical protein